MSSGMLLVANGAMQPDGTMSANYVQQMMGSGGLMAMGIVDDVTGSPATQVNLTSVDGIGSGMMGSLLASGMTVSVSTSTAYAIDSVDVDMHNLPFTPTLMRPTSIEVR